MAELLYRYGVTNEGNTNMFGELHLLPVPPDDVYFAGDNEITVGSFNEMQKKEWDNDSIDGNDAAAANF